MSDQVDKTTFEKQITRQCGRVGKVPVRHRQQILGFNSWKSQKIDFPNFQLISRGDILVEPGHARPDCLDLAIVPPGPAGLGNYPWPSLNPRCSKCRSWQNIHMRPMKTK
jgi:hypothetical protein